VELLKGKKEKARKGTARKGKARKGKTRKETRWSKRRRHPVQIRTKSMAAMKATLLSTRRC
jgi:hypothetical protein